MTSRTWFEVATLNDGRFCVLRLDEDSLPSAIVVSEPVLHEDEAAAIAITMRHEHAARAEAQP